MSRASVPHELLANFLLAKAQSSPAQEAALMQQPDTIDVQAYRSGKTGEINKSDKKRKRRTNRNKKVDHPLAQTIQEINGRPREVINHSYQDLSAVPAEIDDIFPTTIDEMTFAQKVHHFLSLGKYKHCISWLPHGRAFLVTVPASFEKEVLPIYFGHKRYSSFLRQLNNHGFKHVSKGKDRNAYYHQCMLRGLPHLCKYMPEPRDSRRLLEDPDNEPNFYQITEAYPLPDPKVSRLVDVARAIENAAMLQSPARLASAGLTINERELPAAKRQAISITPDGFTSITQKPQHVSRVASSTLERRYAAAGLMFGTPASQPAPAPLNNSFVNNSQDGSGTVEAALLTALVLGWRN